MKGHKWIAAVFGAAMIAAMSLMSVAEAGADDIVRLGIVRFFARAQGIKQEQADAVTDIFTRMLSNSQRIAIIERDRLDEIGREHKLAMSGLVDTSTATEIGRLAGCQYMMLGSVTQLDKKEQKTGLLGIISTTSQEAKVTIDMRVVDVTTGEVVLSMAETGVATDSSTAFNYYVQTEDKRLEGLEAEAIVNAVSKLGQKLRETVADEYSQIIQVAGKEFTLNVGSASGARRGGLYLVYLDGPEVRDTGGRVLGRRNINLAVIKITETQSDFSVAQITDNGGKPDILRRGDKITPISAGEAKSLASAKAFPTTRPRGATSLAGLEGLDQRLGEIAADTVADKLGGEAGAVASAAVDAAIASARGASEDGAGDVSSPSVQPSVLMETPAAALPAPAQSSASGKFHDRPLENQSTDPAKVIMTYQLSSADSNYRRIAHINARKLGRTKQSYDQFVEIANSYSGDYLAAFWLGEISVALKNNDQAREWYDKALAINPDYEPAKKARAKI